MDVLKVLMRFWLFSLFPFNQVMLAGGLAVTLHSMVTVSSSPGVLLLPRISKSLGGTMNMQTFNVNFRGRNLSRIGGEKEIRGENFRGLLAPPIMCRCGAYFVEKTFADGPKTSKFAMVFCPKVSRYTLVATVCILTEHSQTGFSLNLVVVSGYNTFVDSIMSPVSIVNDQYLACLSRCDGTIYRERAIAIYYCFCFRAASFSSGAPLSLTDL